jgi:tRNA A37 threonylcarbamoyladenosine synthetase subunit TsaC/SUA5/YrdC
VRLEKRVDAVIDAGPCAAEPTTVVDLVADEPMLVRRGRGDPTAVGLA